MTSNHTPWAVALCVLLLGLPDPAWPAPRFGGPDAVENQLVDDEQERQPFFDLGFLQPYRDWKARVQEKTGIPAIFFGIIQAAVLYGLYRAIKRREAASAATS